MHCWECYWCSGGKITTHICLHPLCHCDCMSDSHTPLINSKTVFYKMKLKFGSVLWKTQVEPNLVPDVPNCRALTPTSRATQHRACRQVFVYVFRESCWFWPFFTQMRSNQISISVRLPHNPQASCTVIFQYSRTLTWIAAVSIGHFFHPHPASQVTLYTVIVWLPWRNLGELL